MKEKTAKVIQIILSLALGMGIALLTLPFSISKYIDESLLSFEFHLLLGLVPALLMQSLQIMVHEAGHLVAGLLSGYSFVSYRVGSFTIIKLDGKIRFKRYSIAGTAGQCLLKPPAWTEKGIPVTLYNLGGIAANIISFAVSLPFGLSLGLQTRAGTLLCIFSYVNFVSLLLNGIPMPPNDGYNTLNLRKDLIAVRAFWAQMMGNALLSEGTAFNDFPEDIYDLPEDADMNNPLVSECLAAKSQLPLYRHEFKKADDAMKAVLEKGSLPAIIQNMLVNERIWLEIMGENRKDVLGSFKTKDYMKFRKAMINTPSFIRVMYTEALAESNEKEAQKLLKKMAKTLKSYPYKQEAMEEQKLMDIAKAKFSE